MKATIYYNKLKHPVQDKFSGELWRKTHFNESTKVINISDTQFKKYWVKMPITENIIGPYIKDKIYAKYNMYHSNPYSDENDPGQKILKKLGVKHTTMMIGDIIEINNTYYIVKGTGFGKLSIN